MKVPEKLNLEKSLQSYRFIVQCNIRLKPNLRDLVSKYFFTDICILGMKLQCVRTIIEGWSYVLLKYQSQ